MFLSKLRKSMKGIIILVCVAFALTLLYVGGSSVFFGNPQPTAEAVASVNGKTIDAWELQQNFLAQVNMYRQFGQNITRIQEEDVRFNALRQMIDYEIMAQAAQREKVSVDSKELNDRINEIKEFYGASFHQILRQQGLNERGLRDILRADMQVEALRQQQLAVEITEDELREAYERSLLELHARHILIDPENEDGEMDWDAALEKALAIRDQLVGGADFAELALEHSADIISAMDGGSIGWVRADDPLVPEFIDGLFALEGDDISEPIRSVYGYHLIQATDRRTVDEEDQQSFEEVKDDLRARLEQQRGEARFQAWLDEEREKADIVILDPQLRAYQFIQNNRFDQAIAQYKEAIELQPFNPYLHFRLATVLERVDATDEALEYYKEAAELGSGDPELWFALGQAYQDREMNEEARDAYLHASEVSQMDPFMHRILEQIFLQLGYPDLAEAEAAKVSEIEELMAEQQRLWEEQFGDLSFDDELIDDELAEEASAEDDGQLGEDRQVGDSELSTDE